MDKKTKLIVKRSVSYHQISTADGGEPVAYHVAPEDARRIVACVNACAEIETNVLEKLGFGTALKIPKNIRIIEQQRDQLQAERDQLLAALETLVESHAGECSDTDRRWALVDARLAIAAVKGE